MKIQGVSGVKSKFGFKTKTVSSLLSFRVKQGFEYFKKAGVYTAIVAVVLTSSSLVNPTNFALADHEPFGEKVFTDKNEQVKLCHDNNGASDYSKVQAKASAIVAESNNGHPPDSNHEGDIIPPFHYDFGEEGSGFFDGRNWPDGQSIWDNDCKTDDEEEPGDDAKLTLIKEVTGDGELADPSSWTLYAEGEDSFSGTTGVSEVVTPGDYELSEDGPGGYDPSGWTCIDTDTDTDDVVSVVEDVVTLEEGDDVTCKITNRKSSQSDDPYLHFIKVVCDEYSDVAGNNSADQRDDTGGMYTEFSNYPGFSGISEPISPSEIPEGCHRADGWEFLLSTGVENDYQDQVGNLQTVGPTDGGEYVTTISGDDSDLNKALQEGIRNGNFWVSEVEQEGYGFAAIRCYTDALNGDNLEFINIGDSEVKDIYCIAYNVDLDPDDEPRDPPPCGENVVLNGSFEDPVVVNGNKWDAFPSGTTDLEWKVEWVSAFAGAPEPANAELHRGVNGWLSQDGSQHTELDSDWTGPGGPSGEKASVVIYQDLPTVIGSNYEVKFWTSPRPKQGSGENVTKFYWDGSLEDTIVENGSSNNQTVWTEHVYNFVATSTTTRISFADGGTPNSLGAFLDNVSVVEECPEPCVDGPAWAQNVESSNQGLRKNGTPVVVDRSDTNNALGEAQNNDTINFYSLGFGGQMVLSFGGVFANVEGPDIKIVETSYGNPSDENYPEKVKVEVSMNGTDWVDLGDYFQDEEVEMGAVQYARYVRLTDVSDSTSSKFPADADGYDVDGVMVYKLLCEPPLEDRCEFEQQPNDLYNLVNRLSEVTILEVPVEQKTCQISGYKYDDSDGDGELDSEPFGLSGWEIYLDLNDNGQYDVGEPKTKTDENGFYHFDYLSAGTYNVREVNQGGWTQTFPETGKHIIDLIWESFFNVNFFNHQDEGDNGGGGSSSSRSSGGGSRLGSIAGTSYFDANNNGLYDAGDTPIAGVTVYIDANGNGILDPGEDTDVTDADGNYYFGSLAPDTYVVREVTPGGYSLTEPTPEAVYTVLSDRDTITDKDFGHTGTVAGAVDPPQELPRTGLPLGWLVAIVLGLGAIIAPKFAYEKN